MRTRREPRQLVFNETPRDALLAFVIRRLINQQVAEDHHEGGIDQPPCGEVEVGGRIVV